MFFIVILIFSISTLLIGSSSVSWEVLINGLLLKDEQSAQIIYQLRLPRLFTTLLVAMALSISGLLMQTVTQNRLASPTMLGLVDGAALGLVTAKYFHISSSLYLPLICFVCGLATMGLVYLVASQVPGGFTRTKLVLIGIILGNTIGALANIMAYQMSVFQESSLFFLGSVSDSTWSNVTFLGLAFLVTIPALLYLIPQLEGFMMDDEILQSIGKPVKWIKLTAFLVAAILTTSVVSVVGKINFIGLIVPNCIYLLNVKGVLRQFVLTLFMSQSLLLFADILSKVIRYPYETPLSFVLSLIGLPFFFWLIRKEGGHA